jgi:hypothetical protein
MPVAERIISSPQPKYLARATGFQHFVNLSSEPWVPGWFLFVAGVAMFAAAYRRRQGTAFLRATGSADRPLPSRTGRRRPIS